MTDFLYERNLCVDEFNKITLEFMDQVLNLCKRMENDTLKQTDLLKLQNLASIKKQVLIELFIKHCTKYANADGSFNYDFFNKFDIKNVDRRHISLETINKYHEFKNLWSKLNADNKRIFNDHFKILLEISKKYKSYNDQ